MIHIDRNRIDRNRVDEKRQVIKPGGKWFALAERSTREAIESIEKGEEYGFRKDVYAHQDCRAALEKLFHFKCAYCESVLEETDWDVEHFRPKGRVRENRDHSGYYWLAYEWSNLYASCKPCNQRRKDKPTYDDPAEGAAQGKHDQFPLSDESTRALFPGDDLEVEKRLLIDPCSDDPEQYLSFEPSGKVRAVKKNLMGKETIRCMNLSRKRLTKKRKQVIEDTINLCRRCQNENDSAQKEMLRDLIKAFFLRDDWKHAAAARCVVNNPSKFGLG